VAELIVVDPDSRMPDPDVAVAGARPAVPGEPTMRRIGRFLPLPLAGYALFDRGFAYVHLPGIPVYMGELLLVAGLVALAVGTPSVRRAVRRRPPAAIVACFGLWGLIRTVPFAGRFGLDAIRDAALWYYSLFAIVVAALVTALPDLPEEWAKRYERFLPWLLVWSPLAIVCGERFTQLLVPNSDVPVFSHKPGNIAVHAAMALAFLWLVPHPGERQRRRLFLTMLATLVIGITATQSRAGLVSACAVLAIAWLLSRYGVRMVLYMVGTVALTLVFAWSIDLKMTTDRREISVGQLVQNIGSLSGDKSSDLGTTVKWRDDLWNSVLDRTSEEKKLPAGWGFGPNLAEELGFEGDAAQPLRSPHNSHIDVLARMGVVGAGLWIALWLSWFTLLVRTRRRMPGLRNLRRGLIDVCMAGVVGMLVNAYFDPSLESPQVALWLWTLVGLGIGLAMARDDGRAEPALTTATLVPRR
jgi:hypothetical protein